MVPDSSETEKNQKSLKNPGRQIKSASVRGTRARAGYESTTKHACPRNENYEKSTKRIKTKDCNIERKKMPIIQKDNGDTTEFFFRARESYS